MLALHVTLSNFHECYLPLLTCTKFASFGIIPSLRGRQLGRLIKDFADRQFLPKWSGPEKHGQGDGYFDHIANQKYNLKKPESAYALQKISSLTIIVLKPYN